MTASLEKKLDETQLIPPPCSIYEVRKNLGIGFLKCEVCDMRGTYQIGGEAVKCRDYRVKK